HHTRLGFKRPAKRHAGGGQRAFLRLKHFAAIARRKRAAKDKISVLADGPGTGLAGRWVKHARIKRVNVLILEPLLNGDIVPHTFLWKKGAPHDGIGAVRAHDSARVGYALAVIYGE